MERSSRMQPNALSSSGSEWVLCLQDSQESIAVPLLGKNDVSVFNIPPVQNTASGPASHDVLPSNSAIPRNTFQPHLRVKTPTPKTGSRVTSRASVSAGTTDPDNSRDYSNTPEAFGSHAPVLEVAHQSGGPPEPATADSSCAALENGTGKPDMDTAQGGGITAEQRTVTLSPSAFLALDGSQKEPKDESNSSTHTRDTSLLGDMSPDVSPRTVSRSADQYPATPRSPRTPQDMPGDDDNDNETGMDDDRYTMVSHPTDTQSMKSYYRVFGNRRAPPPCSPFPLVPSMPNLYLRCIRHVWFDSILDPMLGNLGVQFMIFFWS
jgi:hypothetical protein